MRDYKNVKVPKKYRTQNKRVTVKRATVERPYGRNDGNAKKIGSLALKLIILIIVIASGWLSWQAFRTITHAEMFQISGVDIAGVKYLGESDLKKIVGPFKGANIFRADLGAAVKRAQANPWVQNVSFHRRLPNRISMEITEREPFAQLEVASGRFLMDNEGVVIERYVKEKHKTWPLPTIVIKDYRIRVGEQVTSEAMGEALMLIAEIAARGGWPLDAVTIKASSPESLSIAYADHEFKIGSGRYSEKLRRLAEVMEDVKRRNLNIAYVDLRPDRQVAVMVERNKRSTGK
jgi:cell division septal protein FtsQ